jgi:two-component system, NtrC family, nitrogen regulation response regulator GlnG
MQAVRSRLGKVAAANVPVLITGESGTGKDIIARLIHSLSPWKTGPYVKVNCPAIPGTLLESELFGYEKGAFTGAFGSKPGRVEMAHRGTLFLDEISELDPSLQSKLLQLLQDGQFCRIGAQEDKKVEVRVVCATNRQLEAEIESGTFRQDLYYRINVVNIRMPALRERRGDIEDLCAYFLEYYNRKFNCRARPLSGEVLAVLQKYHWPGNIRELENLARRIAALYPQEVISEQLIESELGLSAPLQSLAISGGADHSGAPREVGGAQEQFVSGLERHVSELFRSFGDSFPPVGLYHRVLRDLEVPLIAATLSVTRGNQIKAAEILGLNRNTLRKKIRDLDLRGVRGGLK